jgi:hypothetical protein
MARAESGGSGGRDGGGRRGGVVALIIIAALLPAGPGCDAEEWAPEACGGGVLENRCALLFECNPGLWGRPEHCQRELEEGTYPPTCADPTSWLICFCEASPSTCELAAEDGISCGREHCWR